MSEADGNPSRYPDLSADMAEFAKLVAERQKDRNNAVAQNPKPPAQVTSRTTSFQDSSLFQPRGKKHHRHDPPTTGEKPFAFALSRGETGALIWWGVLLETVTLINATREDGKITSITQPEITGVLTHVASNLDPDTNKQTDLGWFGDVYAYWEADDTGTVSNFEIKGPDVPDGENIGAMDAAFTRTVTAGKYYTKIGTVPELIDDPIEQILSSDIPWFVTIVKGTDTPGGSEGSTGSTGSSTGSDTGSDKSTAIVPVGFHSTGYTALFTMEAPDVRFEDVVIIRPKRRKSIAKIDPRFIEVCEKDSIVATSACPSEPAQVGVSVEGGTLRLTITARRIPHSIVIKLSGVRRGFAGMRFPTRTQAQFEANERFLKSAYPRK